MNTSCATMDKAHPKSFPKGRTFENVYDLMLLYFINLFASLPFGKVGWASILFEVILPGWLSQLLLPAHLLLLMQLQ